MSILTIGGDMRYAWLTRQAAARSMEISSIGLENCPLPLPVASLDDVYHAEALILPNPWRSGMSLPYAAEPFALEQVLSRMRPGALLLMSDTIAMPPMYEHMNLIDLSGDEEYLLKNAHLTAEGAIASALNRSDRALGDSMCLVIGYGRIGRRLSVLLKSMGTQVAAAARREAALQEMRADGIDAFFMEDLTSLLPKAHIIFSTPPACVLPEPLLRCVRRDALLMDLASPPYGFDLSLARSLNLNAVRESGLPGRCCPESAGMALLEAVVRALNAHRKENAHATD